MKILQALLASLEREHAEALEQLERSDAPPLATMDDLDPDGPGEPCQDAYWDGFAQGLHSALVSLKVCIGQVECALDLMTVHGDEQ